MSTNRWMDKEDVIDTHTHTHTHTYTMEYYSAIKRNEIKPFAAMWMDLEIIILSEVSQKEKDKYHMIWYHFYAKYKIWYKWSYLQNRNRLTDTANKLMVTKGKRGCKMDKLEVWDQQIQTTIYKVDKQQGSTV